MLTQDGFLLVATPQAPLAYLDAVVLVAVHGEEGSMGFALHAPSSQRLADLLPPRGIDPGPRATQHAWRGGRTRPDVGWMLFDARAVEPPEDSCLLTPEIGVTAAPHAMEAILGAEVPAMVLMGHVGWEPGELEEELAGGAWVRADADAGVVFEAPASRRWSEATCLALELPRPWLGAPRFATA